MGGFVHVTRVLGTAVAICASCCRYGLLSLGCHTIHEGRLAPHTLSKANFCCISRLHRTSSALTYGMITCSLYRLPNFNFSGGFCPAAFEVTIGICGQNREVCPSAAVPSRHEYQLRRKERGLHWWLSTYMANLSSPSTYYTVAGASHSPAPALARRPPLPAHQPSETVLGPVPQSSS